MSMARGLSPRGEAGKPVPEHQEERICLDARRHGVVLVRPLLRASVLALCGGAAFLGGWPISAVGAALLIVAALVAITAVWRWDRTHVVLTTEKLFVVHGLLRRRAAAVQLARVGAVEVEQGLLGRLLGYGTIVVGDLEISAVPKPRRLAELIG
jgi:membrane protein YdbS with pleckstrin-like domain